MSNYSNKQQAFNPEDSEVNLFALLNQILEHKWLALLVMSFTLAVGIFYVSRQIPVYKTDLLIQVEPKQHSIGQAGMLLGGSINAISSQSVLIQTRYILEPVVKALGLDIKVTPQRRSIWSNLFSANHNDAHVSRFEVPERLVNQSLDLVFDKADHVSLYNKNERLLEGSIGQLLTNKDKTIHLKIDNINALVGTHFSLIKRSSNDQVKALAAHLTVSEAGQNTGIVNVSLMGPNKDQIINTLNEIATIAQKKDAQKKKKESTQTLEFLYQQLPITKGLLEKAEKALNDYRARTGKIDTKTQTQFLLQQLMDLDKRTSELRMKMIEEMQRYTEYHPVILAMNSQLRTIEGARDKLSREIKKLPASDQISLDLMREIGVRKTLYMILLSKIQELQVMKAGTLSSIQILASANTPDAPLPLHRSAIYLGSLIIGFALSALYIFGRRLFFPRVDDPNWSERKYNIANLAIIPYCQEQARNTMYIRQHNSKSVSLLAHTNPRNLSIESLRSLRTTLQVILPTASNNIISIMGVSPGVGKSFVSSNLAYLLAMAGKRVLLIDGDLRRGTIHKYFNTKASPGIADVLNETATIENALCKTMHPNLTIMPRGAYPSNPSELLMRDEFKKLINNLSEQFEILVIDTAPVLLVTDAVVIGALSATKFMVLGAAAHQPSDIEMVLKRLSGSDIQLNGTIYNFNRAATITQTYGGYGKYGKHQYYYDESTKI